MAMTYEFYIESKDREPRFVPVMCESELELEHQARTILAQEHATSVEVRRLGEHLFTLVS